MNHHLTTSRLLLVLLILLQIILAEEHPIKNCHEYCLHCHGKNNYNISNVPMEGRLEMSFQVSRNGTLPLAHIILLNSTPNTDISINNENVTLRYGDERNRLKLPTHKQPLSWITLVLDPTTHPGTLLLSASHDRIRALQARTQNTSLVMVTSNTETHVVFNCLSGCFIHTHMSAMVGDNTAKLLLPFTMYLNPTSTPRDSKPKSSRREKSESFLMLTSDGGGDQEVNARNWTRGVWYKVNVLEKDGEGDEGEWVKDATDAVMDFRVPKGSYSIKGLQGLAWTLHCAPEGFSQPGIPSGKQEPGNTTKQWGTTTSSSENGDETGGTEGNGTGEGTSNTSAEHTANPDGGDGKSGRAGAGEVTAWVLAGLALFLVMILAVALCSKTAKNSHLHLVHDSQPSVGIITSKNAYREPEENSEPESPTEHKQPNYRSSGSYQMKVCKVID